jgi:hypothetical protein
MAMKNFWNNQRALTIIGAAVLAVMVIAAVFALGFIVGNENSKIDSLATGRSQGGMPAGNMQPGQQQGGSPQGQQKGGGQQSQQPGGAPPQQSQQSTPQGQQQAPQ